MFSFTLDASGNPALNLRVIAGGSGTLPDSLNDRWYQAFTLDGSGNPAFNAVVASGGTSSFTSLTLDTLKFNNTVADIVLSRAAAKTLQLDTDGAGGALTLVDVKGPVSGTRLISTIATGTAPLTVTSTTNVPNLNASSLSGATFAAPGAIGGTTPGIAAFTTITGTSFQGLVGNVIPALGTFTTVTATGHIHTSTTAPAVSNTTANSCGTSAATIAGTDVAGKVTVGATAGTSCTVTFTTAWTNAPSCHVTNETTANLARATSTTGTVILAGTFVAGDVLAYSCLGRV